MKRVFLFLGFLLIGLWITGILLANFTAIDPDRICAPFFALFSGLKLDALTLFGLFAVSSMLFFYALERRGKFFLFGFAMACVMGSAYGFLQGAWPFGMVEGIWSIVAFRRWWSAEKGPMH